MQEYETQENGMHLYWCSSVQPRKYRRSQGAEEVIQLLLHVQSTSQSQQKPHLSPSHLDCMVDYLTVDCMCGRTIRTMEADKDSLLIRETGTQLPRCTGQSPPRPEELL